MSAIPYNPNIGLDIVPLFSPAEQVAINPGTYVWIPYDFGYDMVTDLRVRNRFDDTISGLTVILTELGYTDIKMSTKNPFVMKAKKYESNGTTVESELKLTVFKVVNVPLPKVSDTDVWENTESANMLTVNVWRMTGDGFAFYDMFKTLKAKVGWN